MSRPLRSPLQFFALLVLSDLGLAALGSGWATSALEPGESQSAKAEPRGVPGEATSTAPDSWRPAHRTSGVLTVVREELAVEETDWPMLGGGPARTRVYEGPGPEPPIEEAWRFEARSDTVYAPAVVGGTVYVGTARGNVYALGAETGQERWRFETGDGWAGSPAVAGSTVCVGTGDGNVYLLGTESGHEKEGASIVSHGGAVWPVLAGGTVYMSVSGYRGVTRRDGIYAFELGTQKEKWDFDSVDKRGQVQSRVEPLLPAVTEETVYFGNLEGNLFAVDTETGQEKWHFDTGTTGVFNPAVAGSTVHFVSSDGNLYAIDGETGREEWRFEHGGDVAYAPALAGGTIYIAVGDGNLYAIE